MFAYIYATTDLKRGTNLSNRSQQKLAISNKDINYVSKQHEPILDLAYTQIAFKSLPMDNKKLQYIPILLLLRNLRIIFLLVGASVFQSKVKLFVQLNKSLVAKSCFVLVIPLASSH